MGFLSPSPTSPATRPKPTSWLSRAPATMTRSLTRVPVPNPVRGETSSAIKKNGIQRGILRSALVSDILFPLTPALACGLQKIKLLVPRYSPVLHRGGKGEGPISPQAPKSLWAGSGYLLPLPQSFHQSFHIHPSSTGKGRGEGEKVILMCCKRSSSLDIKMASPSPR